MLLKFIDYSLNIAIPNQNTHIIWRTRQNIRMIWRELDLPDSQLMSSQSHDGRLNGWSQIPELYSTIRGRCGDKVFVLVKIAGEHLIIVSMNSLDILATSDVPYSDCLVTTAWPENALVSRMPHCLINYEVMHESLLADTRSLDVP